MYKKKYIIETVLALHSDSCTDNEMDNNSRFETPFLGKKNHQYI